MNFADLHVSPLLQMKRSPLRRPSFQTRLEPLSFTQEEDGTRSWQRPLRLDGFQHPFGHPCQSAADSDIEVIKTPPSNRCNLLKGSPGSLYKSTSSPVVGRPEASAEDSVRAHRPQTSERPKLLSGQSSSTPSSSCRPKVLLPLKMSCTASRTPADTPSTAAPTSSRALSFAATPTPSTRCSAALEQDLLDWKRGDQLGCGAFGRVFTALDKNDGHIFVVKMAKIDEKEEEDRTYRDVLQQELDICKDLRHPHIVSYLGHEYVKRRLYIKLEYVPGGSLKTMLSTYGALEDRLLQKATQGVLEGLNYLHTCRPAVMHRDLKCANVLVDLHFCVKLADFGCSRRASDEDMSKSLVGSAPFMAPEVIKKEGHGTKADIWSLGCVVIEMSTAKSPWGKFDNQMALICHILSRPTATPPLPDSLSIAGRDFASACLQRNADDRPTTAELLDHDLVLRSSGSYRRSSPVGPQ